MTPEQAAAYINAQVALFNAEILAMEYDNVASQQWGTQIRYGKLDFDEARKRFESILSASAVRAIFQEANERAAKGGDCLAHSLSEPTAL